RSLVHYCSFLYSFVYLRDLHSFPTRRSSDLKMASAKISSRDFLMPISLRRLSKCALIKLNFARADCFRISGSPNSSTFHLRTSGDRKSTRLNSSHLGISYAVFCLKKKKKNTI